MRVRVTTVWLLAILALFAVACSGSTVVERAERASSPSSLDDDAPSEDERDGGSSQSEGDDGPSVAADDALPEFFAPGGEEQLAGLLDECQAGSDQACDILYPLAGFDSPEEAAALSCGGRGESTRGFCTDGIEPDTDTLFFDPLSPSVDDIAEDCEGGDMIACDFLFFRSPEGSIYEDLGTTCGGRTNLAFPDCRSGLDEE